MTPQRLTWAVRAARIASDSSTTSALATAGPLCHCVRESPKTGCHLDALKASDVFLLLQGLDIGPDSLKTFQGALADAKTVIWNGPMGVFEFAAFAKGTYGVAETLADLTPKVRLPAHCRRIFSVLHNPVQSNNRS